MVSGVLRLLVWQHAKFQNPAVWACPSMCSGCGHSPPLQIQLGLQSLSPLADTMVKVVPFLKQSLIQIIKVTDPPAVAYTCCCKMPQIAAGD